jgi:hypothetical protein
VCHPFIAAAEGAAQVSKARPVYTFGAGRDTVVAIEASAATPPPTRTAAAATAQAM